ncbi:lipoprotein [Leptolyngbya sp. Heron Island J]|uniref:hypothetical protein n=1 Tax=Leptolyngbya sp. Heron Island J TaxID=1385935 RepID=UPI0003B9A24B|nr:hypothetical protein [Leptolyngbya sp. Heron Island J]ESA33568.1 lipoprotein [Leptolyngbya sp. Heron Island J]
MNNRLRFATLGIVATSMFFSLGSCGRSESANDNQAGERSAIAAQPSASETGLGKDTSSATTFSTEGNLVTKTNELPDPQVSKDVSSKRVHTAQPLNQAELALIESELGFDEEIFEAHSFAITLSDMGDVAFVTSRVYREGAPDRLALRFRDVDGSYVPLVPNPDTPDWTLWDVDAVAFEDVNSDGAGPDIIVIAEYMTGIGPTGAQPFPVATVFFNDGDDYFATDSYIDELLSTRGVETIADVQATFEEVF